MEDVQRRNSRSPRSGRKGGKAAKAQANIEVAKRREVVKETLRKKLEQEQRALHIVERLLEDNVAEDFLVDCVKFITSENYKDTVEERSIAKMCGYPLCQNKLVNVPKQQYRISTKTNKVYDITERKCFCSNFCYKASKYFEVQIPKIPLWLREEEGPSDVKLMKEGESGTLGEEVQIADKPLSVSEIENPPLLEEKRPDLPLLATESDSSEPEQEFISSMVSAGRVGPRHGKHPPTDKTERHRSAQEKPGGGVGVVEEATERLSKCVIASTEGQVTTAGLPEQDNSVGLPVADRRTDPERETKNDTPEDLNITCIGVSKKGAEGLKGLLAKHRLDREAPPSVVRRSLLETLSRTLSEWKTQETLRFLYGPDYKPTDSAEALAQPEEELDEDDLEEWEGELAVGGSGPASRGARPSAPLPDYQVLKKETELLTSRVLEFFRGQYVLLEEAEQNPGLQTESSVMDSSKDPALPLVDSTAQHLIQKRIVVEQLNRSLNIIIGPLRLAMCDISTDLNNLVRTFRFTNSNIIHKGPEWTLIAVVLLSVLTGISPVLQASLESPTSIAYISALMKELRLTDHDLQSLVQVFQHQAD
ncbi:putative RNA polymerase II subunit B1 CTD phosphatase rpap2 [Amia ocellicauda]|uniref:putative RNA polymerase II subunit B1 CTD phosphatase rpap2 n=1 Tax=Amia ocellicauda TaxID=2972642 RepID=UPI00346414F3|nr:RPAP2 phosphatase [Amia calva]